MYNMKTYGLTLCGALIQDPLFARALLFLFSFPFPKDSPKPLIPQKGNEDSKQNILTRFLKEKGEVEREYAKGLRRLVTRWKDKKMRTRIKT